MKRVSMPATIIAVAITAVAAGGTVAVAGTSPSSVVYACSSNSSGAMRAVSSPTKCRKNETAMSWNKVGPAGPVGPAGAAGPKGAQGDKGEKGDTGSAGAAGAAGSDGAQGDKGDTGPAGPAGPTGAPGPTGDIGLTGPAGQKGDPGADGATGAAGPKGDTGADGATGPAGPAGPAGSSSSDLKALQGSACTIQGLNSTVDVSIDQTSGEVSILCKAPSLVLSSSLGKCGSSFCWGAVTGSLLRPGASVMLTRQSAVDGTLGPTKIGTVASDGTVSISPTLRCGINDSFADVVTTSAAGRLISAHANAQC